MLAPLSPGQERPTGMATQGTEWWGGRLSDGSLVVLSPSGEVLFLGDSSSASGLPPGMGKAKSASFKDWAGTRSRVPFPYERGGRTIGIRKGTLLFIAMLMLVSMLTANWVIEGLFHVASLGQPGAFITLATGPVTCTLLLALLYAVEVRTLKRRGVKFIAVEAGDDKYLRYVHSAVVRTPEWAVLEGVAREHAPPSKRSLGIHDLLWDAASIRPTLDAGEIPPEDQSRLSEMALFARGL